MLPRPTRARVGAATLGIILIAALLLRLARLAWQPLWWDEGYSVYFATEPVGRMFWLTAHDIHPPLYYLLLHGWYTLWGDTGPVSARLLSVAIGASTVALLVWSARRHFPGRPHIALGAALLLALSPMHLFYSQEVRMYGLALLLLLVATTAFWEMVTRLDFAPSPWRWWLLYIAAATLALSTLYFSGLWLATHQLWLLTRRPLTGRKLRWSWSAALAILLLQLPWWLYALPKLITYVTDKVVADADQPLNLLTYLWRHWLAWTAGGLPPPSPTLQLAINALVAALLLLLLVALWRKRRDPVIGWLAAQIWLPLALGFLINLRFPFFPEGGERLQLAALPFLLLLVAASGDSLWPRTQGRLLIFSLLLLPNLVGLMTFFTLPRYVDHDYRPIVRYVTQHARSQDAVWALFPWQVGYWRAYSPRTEAGAWLSPQPHGVDQTALTWSPTLATQLDAATQRGTLWFPAPLSFGSTLPAEIEAYLQPRTYNVDNRWFSAATRLSAWAALDPPTKPLNSADFGAVGLHAGRMGPTTVAAANVPLALDLEWRGLTTLPAPWRATLRLTDPTGQTWAQRDLAQIGLYATATQLERVHEQIALIVPAGLPPGPYTLVLGVGPTMTIPQDASAALLETPDALPPSAFATLGTLTLVTPASPLSAARLPIEHPLARPQTAAGITLLGYNGPPSGASLLAGDQLFVTLMAQSATHPLPARSLNLSLLDSAGIGQAGWKGWPVPAFPTTLWSEGELAQLPVTFDLPATLPVGDYRLTASFVENLTPADPVGTQSPPVTLAHLTMTRRAADFTPHTPTHLLAEPIQFGTHVELIGYDLGDNLDADLGEGFVDPKSSPTSPLDVQNRLDITLTWRVLQPLLPPHHIFIHARDAGENFLAQTDGLPMTQDGRAPTGSWLPGEYLQTVHHLSGIADPNAVATLQIGLYLPATLVRLPAARGGLVYGDTADIPITPQP
jgi:4-amino-4-deoxy-L-arabinose transferase-like glycosyltransferase